MISREGIIKINNTYNKNIKKEKETKKNNFTLYKNIVITILSILGNFSIFFSYTLPFVFGISAFIIYKEELSNIPLVLMVIITSFTLGISSGIRLIFSILLMFALSRNYIINSNKATHHQ